MDLKTIIMMMMMMMMKDSNLSKLHGYLRLQLVRGTIICYEALNCNFIVRQSAY